MVYRELLDDFEIRLERAKTGASNPIREAINCIEICRDFLDQLRTTVEGKGFESEIKEIEFFRNVKTRPLSLLVYYTEVRNFEFHIPQWDNLAKLNHIMVELERIQSFMQECRDFRFYMQNGAIHLDDRYFTRKFLNQAPPSLAAPYFRDSVFNTSHDQLWATIKGFSLYGAYLDKRETQIKTGQAQEIAGESNGDFYRFTKPATAAMELIYAMKLAGFINNGDFEIKGFVEYFSRTFGIDIKDPYGLFKQITQRKSNRVKYLQSLVDALLVELNIRDEYIP